MPQLFTLGLNQNPPLFEASAISWMVLTWEVISAFVQSVNGTYLSFFGWSDPDQNNLSRSRQSLHFS
jgi:hypothetical protein